MQQILCCLGMYNNRIKLYANCFANGFTDLYFQKKDKEDIYKVELKKPTVTLKDMSEGYYTFYAINPVTQRVTDTMTFFFSYDLPSYAINRLWNSSNIEATTYSSDLRQYLLTMLEKYPYVSLLTLLYSKYLSISDVESFESDIFYNLISHQEAFENQRISNMNRYGTSFARLTPLPYPVISASNDINLVKVYKVGKEDIFQRTVRVEDSNNITVPLTEGLFKLYLMHDSDLCSVLYHCNLSEDHMAYQWQQYQSGFSNMSDIIENNLSSSLDLSLFNSEEISRYKKEISMNPVNPIFPRILLEEDGVNRDVTLFVQNIALADTSHHTFFISGRDVDFIDEDVKNEFFPLIANMDELRVNFNPAPNMIDKEAVLYVADETGKIVSRVTRCIFDEDWTTNIIPYHEKIRQAEINSYTNRLSAQVISSYPEAWSFVQEMSVRCIEREEVNVDNILFALLDDINTAPKEINQDRLIVEVLKDFFSNSYYTTSFFSDGGIVWRPTSHTVVAEHSLDGYVLCIYAQFNGTEGYSKHYLHSKPDQTVEVLLNKFGRYVVHAIRETDYVFSGFMFIDTVTGYLKTYLLNVEVR